MRNGVVARCCTVILASVLVAGCGGSGGRAKTVKVTGVLLLDSKPVPEARIRFVPTNPEGRTAIGDTDADGKFKLSTFEPGDGIVPGEYDADISSNVPIGKAVDTTDIAAKVASVSPPDGAIPERYRDAKTSKLHYTFTDQDNQRVVEVQLSK